MIESKLNKASKPTKDNVAQDIVSSLTPIEIKRLRPKDMLMLLSALHLNDYYSARDKEAVKKLKKHHVIKLMTKDNSLKYAIDIIKNSTLLKQKTKVLIDKALVERLYAAESKRMGVVEDARIVEDTLGGIFGVNISYGDGQLKQIAYEDVKTLLALEYKKFLEIYLVGLFLRGDAQSILNAIAVNGSKMTISIGKTSTLPKRYINVYSKKEIENFVVVGFLALGINRSIKPGRSDCDVLKYGIGNYHGMRNTMIKFQKQLKNPNKKANPVKKVKPYDGFSWLPVQELYCASGSAKLMDQIKYVNEVAQCDVKKC